MPKKRIFTADEVQARIDSAVSEAVREERERCAQIADDFCCEGGWSGPTAAINIVRAIRKEPDHD